MKNKAKKNERTSNDDDGYDENLVLHIHSVSGKIVDQVIQKNHQYDGQMIIFKPLTEFLVCKTWFDPTNCVQHVYLREI